MITSELKDWIVLSEVWSFRSGEDVDCGFLGCDIV
jgi:hypothetical protein